MDKFIVRKQNCGHWAIFFASEIFGIMVATEIAHLETFSDVLVFINVGVMV